MGNGFSELQRRGQDLGTEMLPENQAPGTAEAEGVEGPLRDRKSEENAAAQTPSFTGRRKDSLEWPERQVDTARPS